ncbi:MAG TPA: hypothetical protein VHG53_04160 [Candidatus Limnocylindria bacterium]|nr:hypothetical protein [Candidatus Limnocylindria bacterium]
MTVIPFVTAIVSGAFAVLVLVGYREHRHRYQLMWAAGLLLFAAAAAAGVFARSGGTTEAAYRVFYLFGAIMNVGWLALGTLYLLVRPERARIGLVLACALSLLGAYGVMVTPIDLAAAAGSGRGFPDGSLPRILAALGSVTGSVILIGGALYSAWIFLQRRRNGRRALGNLIIAAGVLVVAAGGTATFTGASGVLELANLAGVSVMFAGFLLIG